MESDHDRFRRIRLVIAYDGTDFCGWQLQRSDRTVQQELERALERMHKRAVPIVGAGRTDSGVHAVGQCAHFDTDITGIPVASFVPALNSLLPNDIRVRFSEVVSGSFHARRDARQREYRYHLQPHDGCSPFTRRYAALISRIPDIGKLNGYARHCTGTHDFSTFAAAGDRSDSKIRSITAASWYPYRTGAVFRIVGSSFLWRMVRSLVGTMLELAAAGAEADEMKRVIAACRRDRAGTTAPSQGLFLYRVSYDETL